MKYSGYIHIKSYHPDEILELVNLEDKSVELVVDGIKHQINISSLRLQCFKRSKVCVRCGLKGTIMSLDSFKSNSDRGGYHFNLYAVFEGKLRLMTKDHITPKSKGGRNHLSNLQTMCDQCNNKKGDVIPIFGDTLNISL